MDRLEHYLDQICRSIGGPRSLREHVRQELREHLLDAVAQHKAAGLPEGAFCCHSFRATTATNLLKQKVAREQVQYLLGHSDARTTDLYNRTEKEVTRNIVERISI